MKNKLPLFLLIGLLTASLSACDSFFDYFKSPSTRRGGRGSSSSSSSVIEESSSSDLSSSNSTSGSEEIITPEPGDLTANKATRTYADFVSNNVYDISATPADGDAKILIIPIWFSDSSTYIDTSKKANVRSDIEKAYFGTNEETGWRSVKTYYEEESQGALTLTGTVSDWYTESRSSSTFGTETTGHENTNSLVKTVADWYFNNNPSENRTDYDKDDDGYLDGVMLIYAAPDYGASNRSQSRYGNLWAYCYWLQKTTYQNKTNPGPNAYFWASYDFMYGKEVYASRTGMSNKQYLGGDTSHANIDAHCFIHEMGHMFGLEDYYDYSKQYSPAGGFSMQDSNVAGHDPFSIFALGWGSAYIPTETTTINLKPLTSSGEMIILTPSWNTYNSAFDEYIIIEYYTADGLNSLDSTYEYQKGSRYPTGSKTAGIRLWHVDARLLYTNQIDSYGEPVYSSSKVTTNPLISEGGVALMMSNTYSGGNADDYVTPLGNSYADYNILQMIRNNKSATHKNSKNMVASDLFKTGDTFSMSDYASQFKNRGKLNSSKNLNFSFEVNGLTSEFASITVTKL